MQLFPDEGFFFLLPLLLLLLLLKWWYSMALATLPNYTFALVILQVNLNYINNIILLLDESE